MSFEFVTGEYIKELGYCMLVTDEFLTLVTTNPPAAQTAQVLLGEAWVVYYQPIPYNWKGNPSWITTYRSTV